MAGVLRGQSRCGGLPTLWRKCPSTHKCVGAGLHPRACLPVSRTHLPWVDVLWGLLKTLASWAGVGVTARQPRGAPLRLLWSHGPHLSSGLLEGFGQPDTWGPGATWWSERAPQRSRAGGGSWGRASVVCRLPPTFFPPAFPTPAALPSSALSPSALKKGSLSLGTRRDFTDHMPLACGAHPVGDGGRKLAGRGSRFL